MKEKIKESETNEIYMKQCLLIQIYIAEKKKSVIDYIKRPTV